MFRHPLPQCGHRGPCVSGPGLILGVPAASSCPEVCGSSILEDLIPEEAQTSWDKDIPAINQGEGTVSRCGVAGHDSAHVVW